jgi:hypothetical protein
MGMFDYVRCEVSLPDGYGNDNIFQTKDFDNLMHTYTIKSDGTLELSEWFLKNREHEEPFKLKDDFFESIKDWQRAMTTERKERIVDFHGAFNFYKFDSNGVSHEYEAKFTDGKLVEIKAVEESN